MKNFVSFNIKAKKKCDADGMILHCADNKAREKSDNVYFPEYQKYNVVSPNILQNYQQVTQRVEEIKGKKIQKNANHYLEGVLGFSEEKFKEDPKKFMREAPQLIEKYLKKISDEFGFEPLGYSLHFDEGHTNKETGKKEMNIHAHLHFVNFDFNTNKARFREYQQKYISKRKVPNLHFVKMQDIADEVFQELGFQRGISKSITNKKHLEKEDFITDKLKEAEKRAIEAEKECELYEKRAEVAEKRAEQAEKQIEKAEMHLERLEKQVESVKKRLTGFFNDLKSYVLSTVRKEKKAAEIASESVVDAIDFEPDEKVKERLKKTAIETDEELGSDGLRSKIKPK